MPDDIKLTSEQYTAKGGVCCPRCESEDITGDSMDITQGSASQRVWCNICEFEWTDLYKLTGYEV